MCACTSLLQHMSLALFDAQELGSSNAQTVVKGDAKSAVIAVASIIAKVLGVVQECWDRSGIHSCNPCYNSRRSRGILSGWDCTSITHSTGLISTRGTESSPHCCYQNTWAKSCARQLVAQGIYRQIQLTFRFQLSFHMVSLFNSQNGCKCIALEKPER